MQKRKLEPLWWRLLVSVDNMFNVILSVIPSLKKKGFGYTDESISSVVGKRYYYHSDRSWFILAIFVPIDKIDKGHFRRYIEHDEGFEVEEDGV